MIDPPVLETLALVLSESGPLAEHARGDVLVLKAEAEISRLIEPERLITRTTFKPDHDALKRRGIRQLDLDADLPPARLTLLMAPRQRDEMRALMARALMAAPEGGVVLACLPNTLGAKTTEKNLAELAGNTDAISKNKCRAFWAVKRAGTFNTGLAAEWAAIDQPQYVADGAFVSRPGLFSWDRLDPGTELLADSIPENTKGLGADFGAGAGLLAREVLKHCPGVEAMHLYEAEHRAIACAEANLHGCENREIIWADVTTDASASFYDFIVMNPPFHTGRADAASLGQSFIRAAARSLKPSGTLWLVANRHLPYEAELAAAFKGHDLIEDEGGYKIIRAERPKKPK